jgi:HAE1 family hydrophobic/amphiphilic exporter-1
VTPSPSESPLVRLSLRRPIMMVMILLSGIVLGFVALSRIPLELIPSGFSPPFLSITVPYQDATATDVEEKIARPLETAVSTTPGLQEITSTSSSGMARIVMVFGGETDMDVAYREVRDRVSRVRGDLPDDVRDVKIRRESGGNIPVAIYSVVWDADLADPYSVIDRHLRRPLERVDGVGTVSIWGEEKSEVYIEVDRGKAEAAGINLVQLVTTLRDNNFTMASGSVTEADGKVLVRSVASFEEVDEIGAVIVSPRGLRLRDIAEVALRRPDLTRYDRYNGRPSLVFSISKESEANTVELSDSIKAQIELTQLQPELSHFDIQKVFIQGDTIRYSLEQVVDSGQQGGFIALFVLLFFLRRLRLTLLISLAIPLSLFMSLPVMYFTGQSVNLISLVGLMICIGLVVDNSVVVAENIGRFRRRGLGPYAAAMQGTGEVALAITLATMTTIVVFLPASLLSEGPTQFFMVRMVTPVCVSLLASLFVAVVLVPLASASVLTEYDYTHARGWRAVVGRADHLWKLVLGRAYDVTFGALNRAYQKAVRTALRRRMDVVMGTLLALGSIAIPAQHVGCESTRNFGTRRVEVRYSMPSDTTLEEANAFFLELEGLLARKADELHLEGQYVGFDADTGRLWIFFTPPGPDDPSFNEMARAVVEALPERPGWEKTSQLAQSDGAQDDSFKIALFGNDHEQVQRAREELERRIVGVEGVMGIRAGVEDLRRRDELSLGISREMSERYGVPATSVANTVAWAIRGAPLPRFHTDEREVDVWIRYKADDRDNVDQLLGYRVPSATGEAIPMRVLAERHVTEGESVLVRYNKRVSAVVSLDLEEGDRPATVERLRDYVKAYSLPEGVTFDADHVVRNVDEMARDLLGALGLGTIFIFLLMGFLFESFVLPLSVLPSIPLSFVGVYWFLYLTGDNIDALAGIGMVLLLGVVVNNAIVLVDFINQARRSGMERDDAIVAAGNLRFRPIMMTALTTIGGMLPLAFTETTGEGIPYAPFGKTLVGGMITATVLTLLVVPVTYAALDDLRETALGWWARLRGIGRRDRGG